MRVTVDIAAPVLADVRREQARQGKPLGQIVSELLAEGLAARRRKDQPRRFHWIAKRLGARVDLQDKDALWEVLDHEENERS